MTSTFYQIPSSSKFYFPQSCGNQFNTFPQPLQLETAPLMPSAFLAGCSPVLQQIPNNAFRQITNNPHKIRKPSNFSSTKKERIQNEGNKSFEEEYLCEKALEKLTKSENKLPSEAENYLHSFKRTNKLSDNEEVSTTTESSGDHKHKQELACAPPRRSRIMQFVNKDLEIYKEEHQNKYKTELCRNWELTGFCKFSDRCAFAHGINELKEKVFLPTNYKTKLCKQFNKYMYCPYGQRCQFLHILNERTETPIHKESACVSYINILKDNEKRVGAAISENNSKEFKYKCADGCKARRLRVFETLAKGEEISNESGSSASI